MKAMWSPRTRGPNRKAGSALTVNHYVRLPAAIQTAQQLADWLEIQFLGATAVDVEHTH